MKIKGFKRRSKSWFRPGNRQGNSVCNKRKSSPPPISDDKNVQHANSVHKRLTKDIFESIVECPDVPITGKVDKQNIIAIKDADGCMMPGRVLRPLSCRPGNSKDDILSESDKCIDRSYKIVHDELLRKFINTTFMEHKSCDGELFWHSVQQYGLAWKLGLQCKKCGYEGKPTKLYEEANVPGKSTGRRAAAPNIGLQVGLSHTPLSNSGFRVLCASIGIPPPSLRGLQYSANKVGEKLVKINVKDMGDIREELKEIESLKGGGGIAAETDSIYNIPLQYGGTRTPGQPATQVVTTISENSTKRKKIIGAYLGNKHCAKAQTLQAQGRNVNCPNHPGHCSKNLDLCAVIGDEQRNVTIAYQDIRKSDLTISTITTDGDSKSSEAIEQVNKMIGAPPPYKQRDPVHFAKTHAKLIKKQPFSAGMFPGSTKAEREKQLKEFARNVSKRCSAEMTVAIKKFKWDKGEIELHMRSVIDAILACHGGDCGNLCHQNSLVCSRSNQWTEKTEVLMNPTDVALLRHCVEQRLGCAGVRKTIFGTSTQKSEAVNRSIRRSLAKNVLYKRNAIGRVHSAIHGLNNRLGASLALQLRDVGADVTKYKRVLMALQSKQRIIRYNQLRQQTAKYKQRRAYFRVMRHKLYAERNKDKIKAQSYAKGLMDPLEMQATVSHIKLRHAYAKSATDLETTQDQIKVDHGYSH